MGSSGLRGWVCTGWQYPPCLGSITHLCCDRLNQLVTSLYLQSTVTTSPPLNLAIWLILVHGMWASVTSISTKQTFLMRSVCFDSVPLLTAVCHEKSMPSKRPTSPQFSNEKIHIAMSSPWVNSQSVALVEPVKYYMLPQVPGLLRLSVITSEINC